MLGFGDHFWEHPPPGGPSAGDDSRVFCHCPDLEASSGSQLVQAVTLSQALCSVPFNCAEASENAPWGPGERLKTTAAGSRVCYSLTLRLSLARASLTLQSYVPGWEEYAFLVGKVLLMMRNHLLRAAQKPSASLLAFLSIFPDP